MTSLTLSEYKMTSLHKAAIASARRGTHQSDTTKDKISDSMAGKKNHAGSKHSFGSKDKIRHERGHDDRIRGKRWIVDVKDKTFRKYKAPEGFKLGKRKFEEGSGCSSRTAVSTAVRTAVRTAVMTFPSLLIDRSLEINRSK